jgi:hypothetical protein
MTETARSLTLPIPCPSCGHVLSHNECDCGFHLTVPRQPEPREEAVYEGHPILL